ARLLGEAPLPEIVTVRADGDGALVKISGKLPPHSVTFYCTTDGLAKADWKTVTGEKADDGSWRCALPKPEDGKTLTLFAELTDARGAIVSSIPGPLTSAERPAGSKTVAAKPPR